MATTAQYLNKLVEQKNTLADNLVAKGVTATHDETLETLVPKVLDITSGGGNGIYPVDETGLPTGDVVVPDNVTNLSASVFQNNKNITSVTLPNTLTAIGNNTFQNCSNLQTINIPNNITKIPQFCFSGDSNLQKINIPAKVTEISQNCFESCKNLSQVTVADGASYSIGNYAFQGSSLLTDTDVVSILGHVNSDKTLGNSIFQKCTNLTNLTIKYLGGSMMFRECSNLKYVKVLSVLSSKEIAGNIFFNCTKLETCYLPEGITLIGVNVFSGCSSLKTVYLPSSINRTTNNSLSVTGYYIFNGCSALEDVQLGQNWNMSLDLSVSNNLTVESMIAMFNNLKDLTDETAKTLTLGETNLTKLTDEQKAIATNKNWTLA